MPALRCRRGDAGTKITAQETFTERVRCCLRRKQLLRALLGQPAEDGRSSIVVIDAVAKNGLSLVEGDARASLTAEAQRVAGMTNTTIEAARQRWEPLLP